FFEVLGVRRVADLAVEHDHVGARTAERGKRLAVRLSRRDRLAVRLPLGPPGRRSLRGLPGIGLQRRERARRDVADLRERAPRLLLVERLSVPAFLVLEEG